MSKTRTLAHMHGVLKFGKKGHYVGIHELVQRLLLKPEPCDRSSTPVEHPSEVQHESIPQAVLGGDIICQVCRVTVVFVSRPCIS
jgi:hypothetical protein